MTNATKNPTKNPTKNRTAKPKKIVNLTDVKFAATLYPNATQPAKSLRARLRRMLKTGHNELAELLVNHDTHKYAIPDTKTARAKFTAIMS